MLPGLPRGPGSQSRCREERTGRVRGAGAFIWAVGISTPMSGRANRKGRGRLSPPEGVSHPCSTQELGLCSRTWRRAVLSALCRLARLSEPHTLPGPLTRPLCRGREPPGGEPPACSQRPAPLCISRGSTELCVLRPGPQAWPGPPRACAGHAAWSRDASHRPHLAAGEAAGRRRTSRHLPTGTVSRVPAERGDWQQGNLSHSGSESTRSTGRSFALQWLTEPLIFLLQDTLGLSGVVCPFSLMVGAFMAKRLGSFGEA